MVGLANPEMLSGLYPYLDGLFGERDPVIAEMERVAGDRGFPIIGAHVGRLVLLQAQLMGARRVLEMGSGYGYSAAWFTQVPGLEVVCIDGSEDNRASAERYLTELGVWDRVDFRVGRAQDIVRELEGEFDIVFCDVDKEGYPEALEVSFPRLKVGGLYIFDNVLWGGWAWTELPEDAPEYRRRMTPGVRRVNEMMASWPELQTTILPLRDGVALSRKLAHRSS